MRSHQPTVVHRILRTPAAFAEVVRLLPIDSFAARPRERDRVKTQYAGPSFKRLCKLRKFMHAKTFTKR